MDIARLSTEELQAEEVVGASLLAKLGSREQARSHDGAPAMSLRATLFRNFGVVVLVSRFDQDQAPLGRGALAYALTAARA